MKNPVKGLFRKGRVLLGIAIASVLLPLQAGADPVIDTLKRIYDGNYFKT